MVLLEPGLGGTARGEQVTEAILGIDAGWESAGEVEHAVLELAGRLGLAPDSILCTHIVRVGTPHYAGSLTLTTAPAPDLRAVPTDALPGAGVALVTGGAEPATSGPTELAASALAVARDRFERQDGRAIRFPGVGQLTGSRPVPEVLADSAIEEVAVLGGPLPADAVLATRDFVRPQWQGGRLVLLTLPGGPGLVAPFEVPDPTPCCGSDHP